MDFSLQFVSAQTLTHAVSLAVSQQRVYFEYLTFFFSLQLANKLNYCNNEVLMNTKGTISVMPNFKIFFLQYIFSIQNHQISCIPMLFTS